MKRRLGVNIDHIATVREARKVRYPDPFESLAILKKCKVDQVTLHLREDRRHIQDHDFLRIVKAKALPVNLELALTDEMLKIALKNKPNTCTFVPEKRHEITTEGGLDCLKNPLKLGQAIERLQKANICVSLFIDPHPDQIQMAARLGAEAIELHTGTYCDQVEAYLGKYQTYRVAFDNPLGKKVKKSLEALQQGAQLAKSLGLKVYAGHGFNANNLAPVVQISEIEEYNIGHAIIARAVFVGLETAIKEIQKCLKP